ncbi:Flp pilus assembly protein CpaB [Novosphingobium piscinae]|uniref:Flp pilus assembly protein CpaB n=1 Tax=Novosphingobium piscinae TaxID=1507448 RepID=A0A7X1G1M8_9SPHN|nr:Flp pilus assembly protein CpaB [Novosphingobium piscinae]MBC2670824.1 Flp pilus assembly protein CpaB [Novosphingobium piscinae]
MDKRKLMLLLGALVVAIGTALAARSMLGGAAAPVAQAVAPPVPQGPKVMVAQRALPVGTIITQDALVFQAWPKEMVKDAYFLEGKVDVNKLLGTVVRFPITAGQPLTQGALVRPGDRGFLAAALGPGMRAVTITVSARTGVAGFVFPGDHVDLMLTQTVQPVAAAGETRALVPLNVAETIIRNLRVLATDQSTDTEVVEGKTVVKAFGTVTLEVSPKLAEKIAVAEKLGTLSLSLRSIADNQSELERAVASGQVKLPAGASKEEENRLLTAALNRPIDTNTTFQTGGDVSRFGTKAMVRPAASAPSAPRPALSAPVSMGPPPPPSGPSVRVTRGQTTTVEQTKY